MNRVRAIAPALLLATPVAALDFTLPGPATLAAEDTQAFDSLSIPTGPWSAGRIEVYAAEGAVIRQAWQLPETALTTLQIMAPLRETLVEAGYEILYECKDADCGGFDFRYQLELLPEPDMHVDLGDFRYLAARPMAATETDFIALTASRSARAGFLHIIRIGAPVALNGGAERVATAPSPAEAAAAGTGIGPGRAAAPEEDMSLAGRLVAGGRAVLDDLRFATGSAELEAELFGSLVELAEWLNGAPEARVALVGHSDAVGTLDRNISLSRARAASVADRLVTAHDVAPGQLTAEGVGYLAPRASNRTEDGRERNRRVEVILLGAE